MKVALVGTRHVHARGLAALLAEFGHGLTAVVERDAEAARAWQQHPIAATADVCELGDALERAEIAVICGTNAERAGDAAAALDAGLHVLCEKPVAIDEASLRLLEAAAERNGGRFMTAFPVRCARSVRHAHAAIRAGAIGTPLAARGTNHGQFPGGWFGSRDEAGGGAVTDHTVHVADALCWLLGEPVTEVYCEAARRMHDIEVEDCGIVTLTFESGAFASIDASWSRPKSFHTWGDVWIEIVGSEGRLVIDPLAQSIRHYDDAAGRMHTLPFGDDMTRTMVEEFSCFALGEGPSPVPLSAGAHASRIMLAAQRSAASHAVERVAASVPAIA